MRSKGNNRKLKIYVNNENKSLSYYRKEEISHVMLITIHISTVLLIKKMQIFELRVRN